MRHQAFTETLNRSVSRRSARAFAIYLTEVFAIVLNDVSVVMLGETSGVSLEQYERLGRCIAQRARSTSRRR